MKKAFLLAAVMMLTPRVAEGQWDDPHMTLGIGTSFVAGAPHRPRPRTDDDVSGAGDSSPGFHVRGGIGWDLRSWMAAGLELSYNRLATRRVTYNCFRDPGGGGTGTCYPAAGVDEVLATTLLLRAGLPTSLAPYVVVGAGAGYFRLTADEAFEDDPTLNDVGLFRPIAKGGLGISWDAGMFAVEAEATLNVSFGRGGGAHYVPITVAIRR